MFFFVANDGPHGPELWKSDGTGAGTVLVKDIRPGARGSEPYSLATAGGLLFFTADDGTHGQELWRSDGTQAGTFLLTDFGDGGGDYYGYGPSSLTGVGGTLFFTADDGTHGRELWRSDGTAAGTAQVKVIDPSNESEYGGPAFLTGVGGTLFFTIDDGAHGPELWKSDGTGAGTVLVKDIRSGAYTSEPSSLAGVGETLFFSARNGVHGRELWKSDGTEVGTVLVKDILPGARDSEPSSMAGVGGTLFFSADNGSDGRELWKSDGTEVGTVLVRAIDPNNEGGEEYDSGPSSLAGVGGTLFFTADDGTHGRELWKSDGTEVGTVLIRDIRPGAYHSDLGYLTEAGGLLFFTARDGIHGRELWKSDGTDGGTVLVKDIDPNNAGRDDGPYILNDFGGTLFFTSRDGIHGRELWQSDGTEVDTSLAKDINLGGRFTVAFKGTANTATGTLKVRVVVAGAGRLVVRPVNESPVRRLAKDIPSAGATTVTLRPTLAGMRTLQRVGRLRINARFSFTPCGGTSTSVNRQYTLRLR